MKKIIKIFLYFIIELIEKFEYRNYKKDENNPYKKIINFIPLKDMEVETDYGFVPVSELNISQPFHIYEVYLENGLKLECADTHIFFCKDYITKMTIDLTYNDYIITKKGLSRVKKIIKSKNKVSMFDFSVETPEHSYYCSDILVMNTVSAAITILHFVLFNNEKGVMIVANKGSTVTEIIDKIKDIYKNLPFFIKKGIINWNNMSMTLENGCRIRGDKKSKSPAIGFTIDLLYFDEFAKVESNIIEAYYGAAMPTVSALNNSKVMITSTPEGFNLFYRLIMGAEKPEHDPEKNPYTALRVYWFQVEGRRDTKLFFRPDQLDKFKVPVNEILDVLKDKYNYDIYARIEDNKKYYYIKFDIDNESTYIERVRGVRINNLPLAELCIITNWKEEQTKIIGGEAMFKQEFGIEFITGDKLLFDEIEMERYLKKQAPFIWKPIDVLEKRLFFPYEGLKWIHDRPDLFNINEAKNYTILASIDLSEGLGSDYTVLNIFRLMLKDKETIKKDFEKYNNIYDYFKLEQIGIFRSNIYSVKEFAHILYLLMFEFFDDEKSKVVLEINTYGDELLAHLPHVFNDINKYSTSIFARFKHKAEDKINKIGLKISRGNKVKILIKEYQEAMRKSNIELHNYDNIIELKTFVKHETPNGEYTYKSESGHDDMIMSVITLSTLFSCISFKNVVDNYINFQLNEADKLFLENCIANRDSGGIALDYSSTVSNYSKIYKKNGVLPNPNIPNIDTPNGFGIRRKEIFINPWDRKY
jgi:hypothetical protein